MVIQILLLMLGSAAMSLIALMLRRFFGGTPPFLLALATWLVFVMIAGAVTISAVSNSAHRRGAEEVTIDKQSGALDVSPEAEGKQPAAPPDTGVVVTRSVAFDSAFQALAICLLFFAVPVVIAGTTLIRPVASSGGELLYGLGGASLEGVPAPVAGPGRPADDWRINAAQFPVVKTLESYTFRLQPALNESLVRELTRGEYINQYKNIVFHGESGTGKTHLAVALGVAACAQGVNVRFFNVNRLAEVLLEHGASQKLSEFHKQLDRVQLLILDELGYEPVPKEAARLLADVVSRSRGARSVILTTHLTADAWGSVLNDDAIAKTLLDDLIRNAVVLEMQGGKPFQAPA